MTRTTAAAIGMRHIGWVSVVDDGRRVRAEVHGVGHRLPRAVRIPLATAAALAAEAVPVVTRDTDRSRTGDGRT